MESHSVENLDEGVSRLLQAIEEQKDVSMTMHELKDLVLDRIDAEPARVETDECGNITATNPAFSMMCGYSFKEVAGRKPGNILQGAETDQIEVAKIRAALKAGKSVEARLVNYHKNTSPYRVHISITPRHDENGNLTGFSATEVQID